jgi:putative membrane protein
MERETGIEPATNSLEGCDSTTELLPRGLFHSTIVYGRATMTDVPVLNAAIFAVVGIVVFVLAAGALAKLAPFDVWRQIVQERNVAAAILAGAVALGVCWIIAATMH